MYREPPGAVKAVQNAEVEWTRELCGRTREPVAHTGDTTVIRVTGIDVNNVRTGDE
jgi:hypothetical protein